MAAIDNFTMIPADDPQPSADDELSAAAAGATAIPVGQTPVAEDPPQPFGRSWVFDFETGRMIRLGASPQETRHFGALAQWCQMAIHSARFAHPVFSDDFGMEGPDRLIGNFAVGEALHDWQAAIVDALMTHDRITSVANFDLAWDPTDGTLYVNSFDVITDEDETVTISDVTLLTGGA